MMRRAAFFAIGLCLFLIGYWSVEIWEPRRRWDPPTLIVESVNRAAPIASNEAETGGVEHRFRFEDIAASVQLQIPYDNGADGNFYIFESTGGGVAILDYDLDGRLDLFFTNAGSPIRGALRPASLISIQTGQAIDVAAAANVDLRMYGHGAAAFDYDNDGFSDLFLTGLNECHLLQNRGDGTFRDVSHASAIVTDRLSTNVAAADFDRDGDLDIYVANYADVPLDEPHACFDGQRRVHCDPRNYRPQPDSLYENLGAGVFRDRSACVDAGKRNGRGFGVAIYDVDQNGLPDVFVTNDKNPNLLFLNQGEWRFEEAAYPMGCALTGEGEELAGMGVACADYDHSGAIDILVTNFYRAKNVLYSNLDVRGFVDDSERARLAHSSLGFLGWGAVFVDADLDGWHDLFVANGHVSDKEGEPYRMRSQFFRNGRDGTFAELSGAGPYFESPVLGRGTASADLNNDGRRDIVVTHLDQSPALLINRTEPAGQWFGLELIGVRSARDAINTVIEFGEGDASRRLELVSGGAFLSNSDTRVVIGMVTDDPLLEATIRWPSGQEQQLTLREGEYQLIVEQVQPD